MSFRRYRGWIALVLLPAALVACGTSDDGDRNLDSLDAELAGGNTSGTVRDPALMSALHDQIMVDPALAGQANADSIRPPAQPYAAPAAPDVAAPPGVSLRGSSTSETLKSAPAPSGSCSRCAAARESLTLGGLAERQDDRRTSRCGANVQYSTRWALRLPDDLPLYPDARVNEAAGSESGDCALRVVSFASAAPLQTILDWYYTRATNAGYSAEHQADGGDHVLAGTRGDAAYALFVTARDDGGSDVDLVANGGK